MFIVDDIVLVFDDELREATAVPLTEIGEALESAGRRSLSRIPGPRGWNGWSRADQATHES